MKPDNPVADQIWAMIDSFRGYSFCKAHSASYTRISFESAYLRCHYPAEFMASVINNEGGFYSTSAYISECMRMGLTILPLDVNKSDYHYKGFQNNIRIGFMAVKGLPSKMAKKVVEERKNGLYQSLYDYLMRTRTSFVDNTKLNNLNAFASISPWNQAQNYWLMNEYYVANSNNGQLQLFPHIEETPPALNNHSMEEQLNEQMYMLGYLINQHPYVLWEKQINKTNVAYKPATEIALHKGKNITLLGFPITKKLAKTRKGDYMAFYSFEDQFAIYDVTFFPKQYSQYQDLIIADTPCFIHGLVESEYDAESITVQWMRKIWI